jgi:hypothetical protein
MSIGAEDERNVRMYAMTQAIAIHNHQVYSGENVFDLATAIYDWVVRPQPATADDARSLSTRSG